MKVLGYVRVSTEEQARSGLGMEAQRAAIAAEAERRGWEVEWVTDDGYSAKSLRRPGVQEALRHLENGGPKVLVVAKLDRLSRSMHDFAGLMERSRRKGWALVALDLGVDTTTPTGELVANVMASVAQWERQIIAQRTRDALAELKARGVRLGRPVELADPVRQRVVQMKADGMTQRAIAAVLNAEGVPTARGGRWQSGTVHAIVRSVGLDEEAAALRGA